MFGTYADCLILVRCNGAAVKPKATGDHSRRSRLAERLLLTALGLVAPAFLLALSVAWSVREWHAYQALPAAVRNDPDPDPLSADAGMYLAGMAVVFALLLFAPPLLAALPARLRIWQAVIALAVQAPALLIAWDLATHGSTVGLLALIGLAYVPALAIVRLVRSSPDPLRQGGLS